jgi:hypothetical protein
MTENSGEFVEHPIDECISPCFDLEQGRAGPFADDSAAASRRGATGRDSL